jgi:hypothetical protein
MPHIDSKAPAAIGDALDHAHLDATAVAELLPQPRAGGELPRVGLCRIDGAAATATAVSKVSR